MAQSVATEKLTIEDWVKGLAAIPESSFSLPNVQDYVIRHAVRPESLEKYCFFSKGNYTRNLVFRNALFECMTLCWDIGQHSRVHNHRGQNCWMSAPIGRLRIRNYRVAPVMSFPPNSTISTPLIPPTSIPWSRSTKS
jgi:cysteine dioxygenase